MNGNLIKVEGDAHKWKTKVEEMNKYVLAIFYNIWKCKIIYV